MQRILCQRRIGITTFDRKNIIQVILTSRESEIVIARCRELGITEIYQGVKDKREKLIEIMDKYNITTAELAYMADDINDFKTIQLAGERACPKDADLKIYRSLQFSFSI